MTVQIHKLIMYITGELCYFKSSRFIIFPSIKFIWAQHGSSIHSCKMKARYDIASPMFKASTGTHLFGFWKIHHYRAKRISESAHKCSCRFILTRSHGRRKFNRITYTDWETSLNSSRTDIGVSPQQLTFLLYVKPVFPINRIRIYKTVNRIWKGRQCS